MTRRQFLVWVSTNHGACKSKLFGENRNYDVAMHDYGTWQSNFGSATAEYFIPSEGTEKLETAGANLAAIQALQPYDIVAVLDDDLEISTHDLNQLFRFGDALDLELYQPALTHDSACSWAHLKQNGHGACARRVPFVEVMCPFFSRDALAKCLWSFSLNQSGWGLDCCIWSKLVKTHVVDSITVRHAGPFRPFAKRMMRNGLSSFQELDIIRKLNYDGDSQW